MECEASFISAGLRLSGTLHLPERISGLAPAVVVCHGFGGNSRGADRAAFASALAGAGHVTLRFDFRGCGKSEGEPGRVICEEEVEDLRNAVSHLASLPEVDAKRIAVIGGSLGGSVAIQATAEDARIRACIANGAIGDGERRFRYQYPGEENWRAFLARLQAAREEHHRTGKAASIDRFDIVAIPAANRAGLSPGARMQFHYETALSLLAFSPERVAGRIAPRPLLLTHPRGDKVVPASESEHLATAAGPGCELRLFDGADHFASGDTGLQQLVIEWLSRNLRSQEDFQ